MRIAFRDSNVLRWAPQRVAHGLEIVAAQSGEIVSQLVFKIARPNEWAEALASGSYAGSAHDKRDGFIHLSSATQVQGTLEKHFSQERNLLLIAFEEERLSPCLKWEVSRDEQKFPHYFGAIPVDAALWVHAIAFNSEGMADLPAGRLERRDGAT